jgi:rhamnosyltransferase
MATFNGQKYIREQIRSIICQEDVEVNIFISDDFSSDETLAIVKETCQDLRVKVNHPGTGSAANNFLLMMKDLDFMDNYQYIAFSDQDDIWLRQKMKAATDLLVKEGADLYCSNLTKWNVSNDSFSVLKKDFPQKRFDYLFEGGSAGCTYVFTREFAIDLQKFLFKLDSSTWKGFSHDWLVYFFARSRNFSVVIDSNSYIHYRLHDTNVHGHLNKLSLATIKEKSKQVFEGYYQNHAKNYLKYLDGNTEEYKIYEKFLGNYFQRNFVIWKYNTQLMRDNKKFLIFAVLNLLKLK